MPHISARVSNMHTVYILGTLVALASISVNSQDVGGCVFARNGPDVRILYCTRINHTSAIRSEMESDQSNVTLKTLALFGCPGLTIGNEDFDENEFDHLDALFWQESQLTSFNPTPFQRSPLTTLNLSENNLTKITSAHLAGLNQVGGLILNDNQIESIEADAIIHMKNLKYLDIAANKLTSLPSFRGLSIKYLTISYNLLSRIDKTTFSGMIDLKELSADNNLITSIDYRALRNLSSLEEVHLESNRLEGLDGRTFENNHKLTELNLRGNNMRNIENFHVNSSSLKEIDIRECNIRFLPADFFAGVPNLYQILASENQITSIDGEYQGVFSHLPNLAILHIDFNKIESISVKTYQVLTDIDVGLGPTPEQYVTDADGREWYREVVITGNPWRCETPDMVELKTSFEKRGEDFYKIFTLCRTA